jgi:hypothetical protein
MPHTNRHQQRALPLRGAHPNPKAQEDLRRIRERLIREIEEREGKEEIKYWERRTWLRTP